MLTARNKEDQNLVIPELSLSGSVLKVCTVVKYLGHYISDYLSDDVDIYRQCHLVYAQDNMLSHKFGMGTAPVKVGLFKAFCTPMYTPYLYKTYREGNIQKLIVAYNDGMRLRTHVCL